MLEKNKMYKLRGSFLKEEDDQHEYVDKDSDKITRKKDQLSEKTTAQEELETKLRYYEQAISGAQELISIIDHAYTYQLVNQYYLDKFELTRDDIVGHSVADLLGKEKFENELKSHMDKALAGDNVYLKHWIQFAREERYFDARYSPFIDSDGVVLGIVISARDITDEYLMLESVKRSDEVKGTIIDTALDAVVTIDERGNVKEFNLSAEKMFGYSADEAIDQNISDLIIPPDLRQRHKEGFKRYLDTGQKNIIGKQIQITATRANGEVFPVELTLGEINLSHSRLFTAFIRDISERIEIENELIKSEQRYRTIVDAEPQCVKIISRDGLLLNMNQTGLSYIEADNLEQVMGLCVYELVVPEDRAAFMKLNERVFNGETCSLQFQIEGLKGTRRWMETYAAPIYESGIEAGVTGHLAVTSDVSERIKNQTILKENEELFRSFFEHGPLGISMVDKDGKILHVNDALCKFSGYSREELLYRSFREFIHPDDVKKTLVDMERLLNGEVEHYQQDRRYRHKQGHYLWIDINVSVIRDINGQPQYTIDHLQDITEQKQQETLQEAQLKILEDIVSGVSQKEILTKLCLLFESHAPPGARASVLLFNPGDKKLYVGAAPSMSEELAQQFQGFMTGENKASCGTAVHTRERVIVEDIPASPLWEDFYEFAERYDFKACWSTPFFSENGEVLGTFAISLNKEGAPTKYDLDRLDMGAYLGSIVVERTRSIEALRISEEKFSKTFFSNPTSMTLSRLDDGIFLDVNDQFEDIHGYSREEAIGKSSLFDLNIYPYPEQRERMVKQLKDETTIRKYEVDIQTSKGDKKRIQFSAELIKIGEENFILGSQFDITEQKWMESLKTSRNLIMEAMSKNKGLNEILQMLAESTLELLPDISVLISLVDEEGERLIYGAAAGLPDFYIQAVHGVEFKHCGGSCCVAARTGSRVIIEDISVRTDILDLVELTQQAGLNSCWSEPIFSSQGNVLGVLAAFSKNAIKPLKAQIELIENQTNLAALAIERKRDEETLRESEARFRSAFGNAPMGTALVDKKGVVLQANSRSMQIIGFSPDEIVGKNISEVTHPDDLAESMEKFIALMSGEIESYQLEKQYMHKNGSYVWCRLSISSVRDQANQPMHAIAHIEDISERKDSEAAMLRYNQTLAMVNQCNDMLIDATDKQTILEQVCDIIVSIGNYRFVWVGHAQADAGKTIMPTAKAGYEKGFLDTRISWKKQSKYYCPEAEAIITSKPVIIKNMQDIVSNEILRDAALARDYHSCIALPLVSEGQAFAVMVIYSAECDVFKHEELTLLLGLTDNLSFAIQSLMNRVVREEAENSLRISEQKFRTLFDENPCMFFTVDNSANILSVNKFGAMELGYTTIQIRGRSLFKFIYDEDSYLFSEHLNKCLKEPEEIHRWEMRTTKKDGTILWLRVLARVVTDHDKQDMIFIVCEDITEARVLSDKLVHQATHDGLTGLINRHEFEKRLQRALHASQSDNTIHVLCFMDLDRFKIINDTCGHMAGDQLLKQLSEVLTGTIRNRDSLARLGGDEFGLLIEHCALYKAEQIANKVKQVVTDFRFYWDDNVFKIGVSIGIVEINSNSISTSNVLMAADNACYTAKDKGRDRIHIHKDGDTELENRRREMLWTTRIQKAFEEERFCLAYQTILPLDTNENRGEHGEILVRMKDEAGNIVRPDVFIPVAERYNLITRIDEHVIDLTFSWLSQHREFLEGLYLCSINLSGPSMVDEHVLRFIIEKLSEYSIPAEKICFEVTETAAIANLSSANHFIGTLKEQGCQFALDDFGSGLSSFAYLKALNVDFLKIDGAFVKDIENEQGDLAIVKSIHEIGRALNKKTIAEFVENDSILKILRGIGVNYAQGYGIEPPKPLIEINTAIKSSIA